MQELFKVMGKFLQSKRLEKNLSQGEVATRLGYSSPQFISNIERGLCAPPLKKLKQLIQLYDLNGEEVVGMILGEHERHLRRTLGLRRVGIRAPKRRRLDS
ncbi:MAG: helix-turn-helix transcriptional regulator [Bdellovibrionales bacterium]|nr:helix-turn-helix transcriptional regulator [Bdellovibrionales bacterium]